MLHATRTCIFLGPLLPFYRTKRDSCHDSHQRRAENTLDSRFRGEVTAIIHLFRAIHLIFVQVEEGVPCKKELLVFNQLGFSAFHRRKISDSFTMRSAVSTWKAFGQLISQRNGSRQLIRYYGNYGGLGSCVQIRWLSGIAGIETMPVNKDIKAFKDVNSFRVSGCSSSVAVQRRGFLGVGDGEEGNMVSKLYEERRILGYSPEQLFNVVAAVDLYQDFLPWCQRSDIVRRYPDGSFDAELEIGFKFLVESYVSHVEWKRPTFVKSTASESTLFDHLINLWEFSPGPNPGTCNVYFFVDFKFQSPIYRQMASVFFKEVVSRLVSSFHERCRVVYGPEVPVLENTHEQRA